jgi:basic membrane lipoprotein Med (substrate-binding protein (PBP1-ABC) superfamily)
MSIKLSALGLAGLLFLSGCAGGAPEGTEQTEGGEGASASNEFKVALLTPSSPADSGWSSMAIQGLEAIKAELGAETATQIATDAKIKDAMRSYAQDGFQLVIGHGFEYNEPGVEIAKDFPKTSFVSSSGAGTGPNAGAFRFYMEQGFYIAGYAAALSSKTGVLGMIGGPDVPSIRSTFKAFKAGAEAAKPGIKVIEIFTGKNEDIAAAREATRSAIGQKADWIIHQANEGAQGVFDMCKEKGVNALGANLNQNDNPSGAVAGSAVIDAVPAFLKLARDVKAGTYKGSVNLIGMDQDAIRFTPNEALKDRYSPEAWEAIKTLAEDIRSGKIEVPKDEF